MRRTGARERNSTKIIAIGTGQGGERKKLGRRGYTPASVTSRIERKMFGKPVPE
jgi:hypothetical protein